MTKPLKYVFLAVAVIMLPRTGTAATNDATALTQREAELREVESAFAAAMAARDIDAFTSFLADEVVFFTGNHMLRGKQAVVDGWAPYFEGSAPFSWQPEAVAVLESGTLGFSSGPVLAIDGTRIGTFNSIWRRTAAGRWEIVFDRGCPPCGRQ